MLAQGTVAVWLLVLALVLLLTVIVVYAAHLLPRYNRRRHPRRQYAVGGAEDFDILLRL